METQNSEKNFLSDVIKLITSIVICEGAGLIGSIFTMSEIDTWYAHIQKPFFSPPNWVFAPVWTLLFLLMGVAFFFVWRKGLKDSDSVVGTIVFFSQLILNVLWSVFFFALHSPLAGLIEIFGLWAMILFTIIIFRKISKITFWLLLPYLLWVSFATVLNGAIWYLN